ncbi:MAG: efflux RND transporter permease subunit, partial [Methylomonas sp.]|nr:efflux RND transporter permease subunit [Methylomonas sp.]
MPIGTPFEVTRSHADRMVAAAERLQAKYIDPATNASIVTAIFCSVGSTGGSANPQSHVAQVLFQVVPPEIRSIKISGQDLAKEWRQMIGSIPGAEQLSFVGELRRGRGMPLDIEFKGHDYAALAEFARSFEDRLATYPGVFDISDSHEAGKQELQLNIKPEAELLGITLDDLARQVQQAFLGLEAQRIQRGRDDVRVVVRYPATERRSLASLNQMHIRAPSGIEVPFADVATVDVLRSPASIKRADRFRTVNVTADINAKTVRMDTLRSDLEEWLQEATDSRPGIQYRWKGQAQEQAESFANIASGILLILIGIYSMLAIPFRSYTQPFIVMAVIPFGLLGALLGHMAMGIDLTLNSLLGMVALIGIVVNDSLVLVDFINRGRLAGADLIDVVTRAGTRRFRPILLTSLTTFAGLCPLMIASNVQAQFLVPMAVSMGFGVLFATFITLFFVPINYLVLDDMGRLFEKFKAEITV